MTGTPTTWRDIALGDVCQFKYGKSLPEACRADGDVLVFGSNGAVGFHNKAITQGPTIVVGRKGSFGEIAFSPASCWPIDTTYYIDRTATTADLRWLAYRLSALGLTRLNRAAAVPGLNREDAYRQRMLLPPLPEQRRIAEVLDRADELRARRRASLAQLDTLAQSIFLDMFGDPIENPKRFPQRRMIELVDPARPITYGILKPGPDQPNGVRYVRVVDMTDGGIQLSGIKTTTEAISNSYRRSLLMPGDLLMSIRGHVGRLAVVPAELEGANITQDTARLAVLGAEPLFVRDCLRAGGVQRWIARRTKGAAVQGINLGDVKLMPIMVPGRGLQREYVRRVSSLEGLRSSYRRSLPSLDSLFASVQARAFAGGLWRS